MDEDFYNAFATPSTPAVIAKNMNLENETGTAQKPPKLMDIDDYNAWSERFGNWVEAYHLDAWEHTEEPYVRPTTNGVSQTIREMSTKEKKKYIDEKLICFSKQSKRTFCVGAFHLLTSSWIESYTYSVRSGHELRENRKLYRCF
ncbi:hypothetical protein Hdeb2414_s0009g00313971 [Helianthus debilis subsp. tardiflorus]